MKEASKRPPVTFVELAYSNLLTLNALVELLTEKGVLGKPEIQNRTLPAIVVSSCASKKAKTRSATRDE